MKFVLISKDPEIAAAAKEGFHPSDKFLAFEDWKEALENCKRTDLMFVDLISTLEQAHMIAGYEKFAIAKMDHKIAGPVPLVLISPPPEYELDFMAGWPDFVLGHIQRPVPAKMFRRASTWV